MLDRCDPAAHANLPRQLSRRQTRPLLLANGVVPCHRRRGFQLSRWLGAQRDRHRRPAGPRQLPLAVGDLRARVPGVVALPETFPVQAAQGRRRRPPVPGAALRQDRQALSPRADLLDDHGLRQPDDDPDPRRVPDQPGLRTRTKRAHHRHADPGHPERFPVAAQPVLGTAF